MKKMDVVKTVGELIVSVGVGAVVGNMINASTPTDLGLVKKLIVGIGAAVLSNMASDKAVTHVNEKIDKVTDEIKEIVKDMNEEEN